MSAQTEVSFYEISDELLRRYIATGSPADKAGAYGIQDDLVKLFTERIDGSYDNVIGLPVGMIANRLLTYIT
jgi:septum formation protein